MKKIIYLVGSLILPICVIAQTPSVKKADRLYKNYSYAKVIEKLEEKKDINTVAKRELAESYKMTGQYAKAEESYARLVEAPDKTAADVFAYAQVLKMNGKYQEATAQMDAYGSMQANDSRVKLLNGNKNYTQELLVDKGQFAVKNLEENSPEEDFGAVYFKDKVVFTSSKHVLSLAKRKWNGNNLNFLDLYISKPDSASSELRHIERLSSVNKKYHEGPASYSKDGNVAFFTVDNYESTSSDGTRKLQLFESKFVNGKWSKLQAFPLNNKEYSTGHAALTADGNTLYFASDMPGGKGGVDLYKIVRGADGAWGTAENMGDKINTEGNEMFPFIHENGLLFFASDGHPGLGGLDVFVTKINNDGIGKVMNLGVPINGTKDDFAMVLNQAQNKGYFSSNREGGKGNDDIYSFDLLKPLVFGKIIKGVAKDKEGNILAGTNVNLHDANGNVLKNVVTGENGNYSFEVEDKQDFKLAGAKENYFDGLNTANTRGVEPVVIADLVLEKDPSFSLLALITDNESHQPLEGVTMKITDETGKVVDYVTPASGDYRTPLINKKLGDGIKYKLELSKPGYLNKTVDFTKTLDKPGEVKVHEALDLTMGKLQVGGDLSKLIEINPIYFDLNKFNIRPDAAKELDKIVKVMTEYPNMFIELGSHTDCRAPIAYNASLSDKRAKASAAYIKLKISRPERIYGKGYGESKLKNGCACEGTIKSTCTEEEHQQNRRTEFIIVKLD
ncbi:MAG: PD40 domain-containing protein [Bacteroidia bacterium]|nr:PD40 domain-containing protein [Bacteroidia bacterium]